MAQTVKLNPLTVELIETLTKHYSTNLGVKLSRPKIIEIAIKKLIEEVK